jgi:hypothetical protein
MVEEAGSRIDTDGPSRCHIKRAVCYAVKLAELELLSFDRFDKPLEPPSLRTAPHTLLRMALLVAWLCRATQATGLRPLHPCGQDDLLQKIAGRHVSSLSVVATPCTGQGACQRHGYNSNHLRFIGRMVEEEGSRIDTDGPGRCHIKRAVCYAVEVAELELLSFDRFDKPLEPPSFRTAPHTLLRMALFVAWLCRATQANRAPPATPMRPR